MAKQTAKQETLALTAAVLAKLAEDDAVRQELPGGGRLRFDRRLPFICVYRRPSEIEDEGTEQLIASESASLVIPAEPRAAKLAVALLRVIAEHLAAHFGSFLVLEVWAGPREKRKKSAALANGSALEEARFEIATADRRTPRRTVEALAKSLGKARVMRRKARIRISIADAPAPPGATPLLQPNELQEWNSYLLGLAVPPLYRHPKTGAAFPSVVRTLRKAINIALTHAFFTFTHRRARIRPAHYCALGQRPIAKSVYTIDHQLAAIGRSFDLLLQATPVNAELAWHEFQRSRYERPPVFYYRPLALDPLVLKRQLYAIPVESVQDATLAYLFRQKQDELDRQITLLGDIDTSRFLPESLQIYGGISDWLLDQATELLEKVPSHGGDGSFRGQLMAADFVARALDEIRYYRKLRPDFSASACVRDDLFSGMMVSAEQLLVGKQLKVSRDRVEALLQHEVGTHIITRYNGRQQPLRQLEVGLAGYDGLQEGLAVLAEFLVGGLSPQRVRVLAGRVVAARQMVDGATFVDTFRTLDRTFEFSRRTAYTITMRVYRGGGLTKDAVYLRGLVQILKYLREGGELEPLYLGKIASAHLPLVSELRMRNVIKPPALRPRYLEDSRAQERMTQLRKGLTVLQLLER